MDLLCNAYSTVSDDDESDEKKFTAQPPSKRYRLENPNSSQRSRPSSQTQSNYYCRNPQREAFIPVKEALIPGRYVSKRERAALAMSPDDSVLPPTSTVTTSPGSISDSDIRHDILSCMRSEGKGPRKLGKLPERLSVAVNGHKKAVNAIKWSPTHGFEITKKLSHWGVLKLQFKQKKTHLLASAGLDHTVCVWNVWNKESTRKARTFEFHNAAVKDVGWSKEGCFLLSCGYDCSSRLIDVEKGIQTHLFKDDQVVGVVKFHPDNPNIFLSGGSKGLLRLWDIRAGKLVHEYVRSLGPILDIDFSGDGKHFISSSDISKSNISENSIIVWDILRQVPLSNQVYVEAYTCPCIKYHPFDPVFVAQSNGNYIAIFSSNPPFRLDKYKRYEKHGVSGFPIKCGFSLDGETLASGSSDGCIYFYSYKSSELVKKIKVYADACVDVAFHPRLPNVVASCSWMGDISVFE